MAGKWAGGGHGEELSRTCLAGTNVGEHDVLFVVCPFYSSRPWGGGRGTAQTRRATDEGRAARRRRLVARQAAVLPSTLCARTSTVMAALLVLDACLALSRRRTV